MIRLFLGLVWFGNGDKLLFPFQGFGSDRKAIQITPDYFRRNHLARLEGGIIAVK